LITPSGRPFLPKPDCSEDSPNVESGVSRQNEVKHTAVFPALPYGTPLGRDGWLSLLMRMDAAGMVPLFLLYCDPIFGSC
jgi:hypothetical protein